jgi:hypothetical protein
VSGADNERRDVFDERAIHLGAGFKEQERPHVLETLAALGAHLKRWNPDEVDVEVSVQDRGGLPLAFLIRTLLTDVPLQYKRRGRPDCQSRRRNAGRCANSTFRNW